MFTSIRKFISKKRGDLKLKRRVKFVCNLAKTNLYSLVMSIVIKNVELKLESPLTNTTQQQHKNISNCANEASKSLNGHSKLTFIAASLIYTILFSSF